MEQNISQETPPKKKFHARAMVYLIIGLLLIVGGFIPAAGALLFLPSSLASGPPLSALSQTIFLILIPLAGIYLVIKARREFKT